MNAATLSRHERARPNWAPALMFLITFAVAVIAVPWYGLVYGYHTDTWIWFVLLLGANGMAITCGYHRLYAHSTYEAHPALQLAYMLFGAMALQNSALVWCAGHRTHHRRVDDPEHDPYCARRGFWFSHIGWMLRDYPTSHPDLGCVRDLRRNPLVMWQHRHYLPLALVMNFGLPLLLACLSSEFLGVFLLVGVLRLVVSHHVTFFINSLAHMWGSQPYTDGNTARDNDLVALLTYGEGYHNFHHRFAHDYRNGIWWWQWDPSKWFINAIQWLGLSRNLKRVSGCRIYQALLETQLRRTERELARLPARAQTEQIRQQFVAECEALYGEAGSDLLRARWSPRTEPSTARSDSEERERSLQLRYRRARVLQAKLIAQR